MKPSSRTLEIERIDGASRTSMPDRVAVEEPLEIQLVSATPTGAAARSVSITMRTPGNDAELALGFLFTEGIISAREQVVSVSPAGQPDPDTGLRNIVRVEVSPEFSPDIERLERHFYTTSSCGVCGKASLDALRVEGLSPPAATGTVFDADVLHELPGAVRAGQAVFDETGGLHAAALFGPDGEIGIVREDVGRHNATDKLIGRLFEIGDLPAADRGLFVSGRASFELMQKALAAGIPLLAAVGAPTSLAVELAQDFGMTLVGFMRDGRFNIYAGGGRIR